MSHHSQEMSVSLVLIKVQPTVSTAKLGYQFSGTTNLTKGRKVFLSLQEGLKGLNVYVCCGEAGIYTKGSFAWNIKRLKKQNLNMLLLCVMTSKEYREMKQLFRLQRSCQQRYILGNSFAKIMNSQVKHHYIPGIFSHFKNYVGYQENRLSGCLFQIYDFSQQC